MVHKQLPIRFVSALKVKLPPTHAEFLTFNILLNTLKQSETEII